MIHIELFSVLLFIHVISLIVGFGSVIVIDSFGLLWLMKKVKLSLVNSVATVTEKIIWIGWSGLVLSGLGMIFLKGAVSNLTIIKLFFVIMLAFNGVFLYFIKKRMETVGDDEEMLALYRFRITLASNISQIGWWGAIIIGFINTNVPNTITGPEKPWLWICFMILLITTIAFVGESVLRKKPIRHTDGIKITE